MNKNKYLRLVIIVSLIFTLLNSAPFFYGLIHRPNDKVYLGTIHYYQDYFFYVSQFYQGAHGKWLNHNLYTGENTSPSLIYWQNIILGKIFSLFGLRAEYSYNFSLIALTFFRLLLTYLLIKLLSKNNSSKAFLAFIFHLIATSFLNRIVVDDNVRYFPFLLWRTYQFAFFRLGGIPHHALETIFFIILTFYYFKNIPLKIFHLFLLFVFTVTLTLINPVPAALFIIAIIISLLFTHSLKYLPFKKSNLPLNLSVYYLKLIPLIAGFSLSFNYLTQVHQHQPFLQVKLWEQSQQIQTSLPFLFASMGPIVILAIIGIIPIIKNINPASFFIVSLPFISYTLFLSGIPKALGLGNFRLMFNGLYIFFGILASEAVFFLNHLLDKKFSLNKKYTVLTLACCFIIFSVPTLIWELKERISISKDQNSQMVYLDQEIYSGFKKLEKLGNQENTVLANSSSAFDTLIPALSGHKTFSGHNLLTINSERKSADAAGFFQKKQTFEEGKKLLSENKIKYIFFTDLDGNPADFQNYYPFLKPVFENQSVTIFAVNL